MNMKALKYLGLVGLLVFVFGIGKAWAANPIDATITVTPVATVSLTLPTTTYAFGNVPVNTSTSSAAALTLNNAGTVGVSVQKEISNQSAPAGWIAGGSAGADQYVLYCATAAAEIPIANYTANTKFASVGVYNDLTNAAGLGNTIAVSGSVGLWFRLDMPTSVGSQVARTITIRFNAAAL